MECKGHFPAVTCALTERTLSHGELQEESLKLSNTFQGLPEIKTVGIILPNCIEYPGVVAGCMHAGLTVTTVNPAYTVSEIAQQLQAAKADVIFADSLQQEKISEVAKAYPLKQVVYINSEGCEEVSLIPNSNGVPYDSFKSSQPASTQPEIDTVNNIALMPFSSGTTGPPKGVQLTQQNLVMQTLTIASDGELFNRANGNYQDTTIAVLPMYHIFGLGVTMTGALWAGAQQVTIPRFDPALYLKCIKKYRPAFLHVVPPLVGFLANNPQVTPELLSSLREMNCGAAPCGSALQNSLKAKAPRITFKEGWGMSEVAGAGTMFIRGTQVYTPGSVNQVIPNMRIRIVDPDSGEVLGTDQPGEIQCVGPAVMKGYFNNEKANETTFTEDGWMRTGDIGYYNENALLFISDRMKELIKVKGMQVAPAEVENVLRQLEGVMDVAVIGVDDERAGQLPKAFIVRQTEELTEDKINAHMAEKLSEHKQLKGGIIFTDSIPRSAAGKILKRELKK